LSGEEPEAPLARAGVALVLGGAFVGLSLSGSVGRGGSVSGALLMGGSLFVAGGVVASLRSLHRHWKDGSQ